VAQFIEQATLECEQSGEVKLAIASRFGSKAIAAIMPTPRPSST
jgi:hypothetical protein